MIAAIYSRKSKYTAKGESIENQIQLCKDYARNLNITEFKIYEDEGFSGGNIDRPEFQRLLKDAKAKKFNILICYRLDRISRNVLDFSNTIEDLNKLNIGFISIREQFDTSTPMGRAMMYIASVFAQLERETIAERIKDNMNELAKTGRWLGGPTPFGFKSERIMVNDKEETMLVPEPEEIESVKLIFGKYLEFKSLFKVNKYLINNDIKTKLGGKWTTARVLMILKNPVYSIASEEVLNYFISLGSTVIGTADNAYGIMSFNRSNENNRFKDESEWIIAIGKHKGVVSGSNFVKAQELLNKNHKIRNTGKSKVALLTGLLRCNKCKSTMGIVYGVEKSDGSKHHYYKCTLKISSGGTKCTNKNVNGTELEEKVIEQLKRVSSDKDLLKKFYESNKPKSKLNLSSEINKIKKAITKNEQAIQNLVKQLSLLSSEASTFIITEIEKLSKENSSMKSQLSVLEREQETDDLKKLNDELSIKTIELFSKSIDVAKTVEEKRRLIESIVKEITWDGETGEFEIVPIGV